MLYHDTEYNPLSANNGNFPAMFKVQRVHCPCAHCGKVTVIPVPAEYIDWKIIAEDYRKEMQKAVTRFDQIVKDIDVMSPDENPVRQYLHNQWEIILDDARRHFGG